MRRLHVAEPYHPPFSFGNDLVFDHQDVSRLQPQFLMPESQAKFLDEIVAGKHLAIETNRNDVNSSRRRHQDSAATETGRSLPNPGVLMFFRRLRASSCERFSPADCASCRRSSGVSMSRPIR